MPEAVIVSAVRTPIGRASKGALRTMRADDLAAVAVRAAAERVPNLDPELIEDVILGCAFPEGEQGMNLARIVTALAGLPVTAGGVTVNRFCASSLQAFNMAAQNIMLGMGDVFVAGGVESMSRVPMGGFNPSFNPKLINNPQGIEICGMPGKTTTDFEQSYIPMGMTAENLAREYNISREDQDAFALRSHQRAIAATDNGIFAKEIVPVTLPNGEVVSIDDGPRRDTSLERLATLEPAFIAGGTRHRGQQQPAQRRRIRQRCSCRRRRRRSWASSRSARVLSMAVHGRRAGDHGHRPGGRRDARRSSAPTLSSPIIDIIELNEAFAAQSLAVVRTLGIDEDKLNPHGGAIALGHPLGCSGARLIATLLNDLETEGKRLGLATLCVGGGQGLATIIERL